MTTVLTNGNASRLHAASSSEWMEIQRNTFKNWVNEQLKSRGLNISDVRTDFDDGVLLIALVELLQRKKVQGGVQKPIHNHERLHNITIALDAIAKDGVTLINIDSTHITEGNTKLILALIWQLVLRYQIGLSNFQHRSWLLGWAKAVLPDCALTNLTTDWNSGVALHALLEFCKPGLCPSWRELNPLDKVNNCRDAMKLARQHFGIPLILRPEDLASNVLDELSAITYLSYFTKVGSPGYNATLQQIQPLVRTHPVFNFTSDWCDGQVLCELVTTFGGNISVWPESKKSNIERLQDGLDGAKGLGIEPLLGATELATQGNEHLGIMAYAARFFRLTPGVITYERTYKETKVITVEENNNRGIQTNKLNLASLPNAKSSGKDSSSSSSSSSSSASTMSKESQHQLEYTLVRTPSLRRKHRHGLPKTEGIKKDTYSDGVIIYATSHELVTSEDIRLEAESPTGRLIKMNGDGNYHAQFALNEIGTWNVGLLINNRLVDSCKVDVCDPSQVRVSGLRAGLTGTQHNFQIDCSNAGKGKLEVNISVGGMHVPCYLRDKGRGVHQCSFTPVNAGHYLIGVAYNKAEIRDDAMTGPGVEELHRQAVFSTTMKPLHDYIKITASCDWQIDYMTGGPIDLYIGDTADVRVYSMQDGTICNTPHLIADLSHAPGGTIEAEVTYGPHRFPAEVHAQDDKPDVYRIMFKPRGPGTYKVWINCDGRLVKGSPFLQEIDELTSPSMSGLGLKRAVTAEPAEFTIDARGFPGEVTVDVQGPHYPLTNNVSKNPDNTYTLTYVPEEVGIHRINIKLGGKDIAGSPFHPKIVDPTMIRVSGGWKSLMDDQERIALMVGKEKHIPFDASDAGPGELTANVHGPSDKVPVTVDSRGDGKHTLIFTPREEGKHNLEIFWNEFPILRGPLKGFAYPAHDEPDYPIIYRKQESPVEMRWKDPVMIERSQSARKSAPPAGNWVRADRRPGTENGPHKVYILSPAKSESHVPEERHTMYYPPTNIRVYRHGSDIADLKKPKHYLAPNSSGSVRSGTTGTSISTIRSEPKKKKKEPEVTIKKLPRAIPIYHYDSAPNSESYIYPTSPQSSSPPSTTYLYTGQQQKSPVDSPDHGPSPKVILSGQGLKRAELNRPAVFFIDGRNAGSGEPEAKITSVRSEAPVDIKPNGPRQYKCTYTPTAPGAYLLDIKWRNRPLKCCPFKIDVHSPVYPDKVGVTGDHLKGGVLGKDLELQIDPREAGKGELTIDCKDPDDKPLPVHTTDNFDGTYKIRVRPVKPGTHILNIRINKEHVFGSPFAINVSTPRPRSLGPVKVYGPGLESGVFPNYQGHFYVDATVAGGGELHVSVMGLKGAFHVEMQRASQKDKLFNCLYHPVEPGLYTINVQWAGAHVHRSPYKVFVAGSEMDLLEYESQNKLDISRDSDGRLDISRASSGKSSSRPSPNTTSNSFVY